MDPVKRSLQGRKVLIIVENLPLPFDRRVWQECLALTAAGAQVAVICPTGKGYEAEYEEIEGVHIYRHPLPSDGVGALSYLVEYSAALFHEFRLSLKVLGKHGFDVIQGCNPPDLIFLVAAPFKLFGKKFIFDHHDLNPELFEAKFERRGLFWRLLRLAERLTFATADVCIATNNSYREVALTRGRRRPEDVFVVRSGPDLNRVQPLPPNPVWKNGRRYMAGYVGVMGEQEGLDLLLEAFDHIVRVQGRQDIQLCLVGGGPSLESIRAMTTRLKLDDYVTITGRVPDAQLFEILSTADVCVNPDRVNPMNDKSTMNKILEYMAMGKAIVQFDVAEGRVSAEDASAYAKANDPVDFAEQVVALIEDPERRAQMGEIGRLRIANELSWTHQVPPLIAAYERALNK